MKKTAKKILGILALKARAQWVGCMGIASAIGVGCLPVVLFLFLSTSPLLSQTFGTKKLTGTPFIRNYQPEEYQANGQNWAIQQDQQGILYFGNSDGVLEYDGVSWRLIPTQNKTVVRSLALDQRNRIYTGAYGEIGYLAPDPSGQLEYQSLLPKLDTQYQKFADVWQTIATSTAVYFVTQKAIFRWDGQQMHVWKAAQNFHVGFLLNDQFYVRQWGVGLMRAEGDSLNVVPGGASFSDASVFALLPFSGSESKGGQATTLVGTRTDGLFLYDGLSLRPFPTAADGILKEALVYHGIKLTNGHFAFATLKNGVVVIDRQGNLVQHLNKAAGLQDETVWFLYLDRQDGLWVGLDAGISRVEIASPFTQFSSLNGLEGNVQDIAWHNGTLYVATSLGTFFMDGKKGETQAPQRFQRMTKIPPQCWALLPVGPSLLVASFDGVFEIRGQQVTLLHELYTFSLHRSQQDTNRVFAGLQKGMMSLYHAGGQWRDEDRIDGIDLEIRDILEAPDKKLWLTTRYQGLLQVDFSAGFSTQPPIARFDTLHGLPPGDRNFAFLTNQGLRFGTPQGIYRLDETGEHFLPDTSLIKGFPDGQRPIFSTAKDIKGNLWIAALNKYNPGLALLQPDGSYLWEERPFLRVARANVHIAYPDPFREDLTWLGGEKRMLQFDASVSKNYALGFDTQIRQLIANGDSTIFGGAGSGADGGITKLAFANNNLRFRYAALSFEEEAKNEYQYRLEGYDDDWSKWSSEPQKDYTGLPAGHYRFLVRSKNIFQQVGTTAAYDFQILPPFYLTWWAYGFYALLFIGALFGLRQYELKKMQKRQRLELERLEFNKLKELDQLKSRFFTDISHEFRTPLTVISGMAGMIEQQPDKARELIQRNSQGLLRLVNQVLDLAKLESGHLKLELKQADVVPFAQYLVDSFQSFAAGKNIDLVFQKPAGPVVMDFDEKKLESIISNLLSNAIKFSKENGTIHFEMREESGQLVLHVRDNGIGIPAEKLPYVFDRFYQASPQPPPKEGESHTSPSFGGGLGEAHGSGIGLALTKELVAMLGGKITVESSTSDSGVKGAGTAFTVTLPIRQNALVGAVALALDAGDFHHQTVSGEAALANSDRPEYADLPLLLLIEDNPDLATYIRACLHGRYTVEWAGNGATGIEIALETIPDIIISDVMMPEKDGFEVTHFLKNDERTSHIPIVLLTAKADVESRLEGLGVGADAYLAKPFLKEELFIRLQKLVELRRALQRRYAVTSEGVTSSHTLTSEVEPTLEDVFLEKASRSVLAHLDDAAFGNEELSREMAMSESQLNRKVKALTGKTLSLFIRSVRLQQAKILLQTTDRNISEIAYAVGFSDPAYFTRTFSQEFGGAPSRFRG